MDISTIINGDDLAVWIDYNEDVSVQVRHVPREELSVIMQKSTKTTWDRKHQAEQSVDNIKYGELMGEAAIVDWSGLEVSGVPLPCTKENRALIMRKWSSFAKFVSDASSDLDRLIEADRDAARKN